jgi:hypothetical protein
VPDGLVDEVEQAVRAARALTFRKLTSVKLARNAEALLHEALAHRGLERTGKHLRVPLAEQLGALLSAEPEVPIKTLRRRLGGVSSAAELKRALAELVADGEAVVVLDGKAEGLCRPGPHLFGQAELEALRDLAVRLTKLLRSVKARKGQLPRTLRRAVIPPLLAPWSGAGPRNAVLEALRRMARVGGALVFVPELVRDLSDHLAPAEVHRILEVAARDGEVELRPESGVGLLTAAEAALCPILPDGTRLSYVRRLER